MRATFALKTLLISLILFSACKHGSDKDIIPDILSKTAHSDSIPLRITSLKGSLSFFTQKNDSLGLDFELASNLAEFATRPLEMQQAKSETQMLDLLREKKVDLIAMNVYATRSILEEFDMVVARTNNPMVLVQSRGFKAVNDVLELRGKKVKVPAHSVYAQRLEQLNDEIGGGIQIELVSDTTLVESLLKQVAAHKAEFTLAHRDKAVLFKKYYKGLDVRLQVSVRQRSGWLIRKEDESMYNLIHRWQNNPDLGEIRNALNQKYEKMNAYFAHEKVPVPRGNITPYDKYFRKYAVRINWDWKLLAALSFRESSFDSMKVSRVGAAGLMQLMPRTAAGFGLEAGNVFDAEKNIEAGVEYIKSLNMLFRNVQTSEDRIRFVLASYNSGPAHVMDAMALAEKYGKNQYLWYNHVEYYFQRKKLPEFYQDPVVKRGQYNAASTIRYIQDVLDTYQEYAAMKTK